VTIFEPDTGEVRRVLDGTGAVSAIAFPPDGAIVAVARAEGRIDIFATDGDRPSPVRTIDGHAGGTLCMAFDPTGLRLASGGEDRALRIWDRTDGTLETFTALPDPVRVAAWSPTTPIVACASRESLAFNLFNVVSGSNSLFFWYFFCNFIIYLL
jgi:WD40 repeat protein